MKPDLKIRSKEQGWELTGNTVVKKMDDTEMLFRIVIMTPNECDSLIGNLSDKQLHDIVVKIREHRRHAEAEGTNVTSHVVKMHVKTLIR